ncbi:MAG: hypothetical protein V4726_24755 [Verrucomicrobiota bacterium]
MRSLREAFIILAFPYLAPAVVSLVIGDWWNLATNTKPSTGTVSNTEVPSYFVVVPMALIIQIVAGVPGNLFMRKSISRAGSIFCCVLMTRLPLMLITGPSPGPVFFMVGLFGSGSCVSFYFLHHRRLKNTEQDTGDSSPPA